MGERMRALDWAATPMGRPETWPERLATLVTTSLRSRFPIVIWWNQQHYTMFYNDAYIPALGKTKHPLWLGRSGKGCWQEIWPTIGPMLEGVFATGQPTWIINRPLRRGPRPRPAVLECQPPLAMNPGTPVSTTELSLLLI